MAKKLEVCNGKKCKQNKSHKLIKSWGKELKEEGNPIKIKKTKCLGKCKKGFACKVNGEVHSCKSKEELEAVL